MLRITSILALALVLAPSSGAQIPPCLSASDNANYLAGTSMGGPNLLLGIKLTNGPSALAVQAAEVFTGGVAGLNSLGIWSHDAANNRPGVDLATGSWVAPSTVGWKGVNLPAPVFLSAGQDFWLVWGPQNGSQISAEVRNTTTGQPYRGSFDGGQSWNGPFVNYDWKFRLHCNQIGGFSVFGQSCAGSGRTRPTLGLSGSSSIGQSCSVLLTNALPTTGATAFLGFSNTSWNGVNQLPFDMTLIGAPGCFVLVDLLVGASMLTDARGGASLTLSIPSSSALVGVTTYAQWAVVDASANALQVVTSNAGGILIGN